MKLKIRRMLTQEELFDAAIKNNNVEGCIKKVLVENSSYYNKNYFITLIKESYPQYIDVLNKYLILK